MSSVQTSMKQSRGYFVATSTAAIQTFTVTTAGSGSGGSYVAPVFAATTLTPVIGMIFKDMGKTVATGSVGTGGAPVATVNGANPRFFRKVQLLNTPVTLLGAALNPSNGVNSGRAGTDTGAAGAGYNTFYIELPTGGQRSDQMPANLAYVPGLPGFYF